MAEKVLKLYKKLGDTIKRFPDVEEGQLPLVVTDFTYDAKRMGGAPTIQCTIMYHKCLDDEWTKDVYTEFRSEKYYIKQTPSSTKDNKDARWKHECEFISERRVLDNVYFFDIVKADEGGNKPVSNSTDFTFFGDIFEFATRLTESMKYAGVDYVVDAEKHRTELTDATVGKQVTFQDKFISEALQEIFNVYGYHYYFEGKTIYIGDSDDYKIGSDENPLEYGATKALISVQKSNANYKPINKITSRGSDQNIPYYYPNPSNEGEIGFKINNDTTSHLNITKDDMPIFNLKKDKWDKIIFSEYAENIYDVRQTAFFIKKDFLTTTEKENISNLTYTPYNKGDKINALPYFGRYYDNITGKYYSKLGMSFVLAYNLDNYAYRRKIKASQIKDEDIDTNISYSGSYSHSISNSNCAFFYNNNGALEPIRNNNGFFDAKNRGEYSMFFYFDLLQEIPNSSVDPTNYTIEININNPLFAEGGFRILYKNEVVEDIVSTEEQPLSSYGITLDNNYTFAINDEVTRYTTRYWKPQKNLMPKVYINSGDTERFYTAKNYPIKRGASIIIPNENIGEYKNTENGNIENDNYKDDNGEYYQFENPYVANNPYEHIIDFEDIMPTIEGVENEDELRIDMFSEFAYDDGDNNKEREDRKDNKDESGELRREHPYFFGKLRKMPFNLFDHAIEGGEMTIAMTSGSLGSCKFVIHVGEEHQKNIVQVYEEDVIDKETGDIKYKKGELKRDDYGNILCGRRIYVENKGWEEQGKQQPQDKQNDTRTNEVWVALAKDTETFTTVMPYAQDGVLTGYRPKASEKDENENDLNNGDTFVILNIKLPQAYIDKAEEKLTKETIKYLAENNKEKFSFAIDFSRIYLAENLSVLESLSENSMVYIKHNNNTYKQYISSYSYKMSSKDALPEIKVELSETLSTQQGALQQVINAVKSEVQYSIGASGGSGFRLGDLDRQYIRRDTQDTTTGVVTFMSGTKYGKGKEDGKTSAEMQIDDENNSTLTVDNLIVRNNDERVQELIERIVSLENKINELTNN